jgi:tetrahydromethanopterin S-methyltransferase subunit G
LSTPEHIEKIHFTIGEVAAQLEGCTVQGAKERLKEGNRKAELQEIKERLSEIKKFLENIKDQLSV